MEGISPILLILFVSSVFISGMGLLIHIDNLKHQRDLARINEAHWKKMYEIRTGQRDKV